MWVDRKESEGVDLDKRDIIDKTRRFYKAVCRRDRVVPGGFKASSGWLYRFLKRKKIHNVRCTGESRSTDVAAKDFPDVLRGIEEGGCHPDAIYNMGEAGLQYKLMPKSTFIAKKSKQARGQIDKTHITLCLCVNQSGTRKMEELLEVQAAGEEITAEDTMDSATLEDRLQEEGTPPEGEVVVEVVNKDPSSAACSSILLAVDSLQETLVTAEVCTMR